MIPWFDNGEGVASEVLRILEECEAWMADYNNILFFGATGVLVVVLVTLVVRGGRRVWSRFNP